MRKSKDVKEGTIVIVMDLNENGVCEINANTTVETREYFLERVAQFLAQEYVTMKLVENA